MYHSWVGEDEIDLCDPPLRHDLCTGRTIDQATKQGQTELEDYKVGSSTTW